MFRFSTGASVFRACFRSLRSLSHALVLYITSHSLRYFAGFFTVIVAIFALSLPSAYVVEEPGPTQDVLGSYQILL